MAIVIKIYPSMLSVWESSKEEWEKEFKVMKLRYDTDSVFRSLIDHPCMNKGEDISLYMSFLAYCKVTGHQGSINDWKTMMLHYVAGIEYHGNSD